MVIFEHSTLPDLLQARSQASAAKLNFLDTDGNVVKSLSYAQLLAESQDYAARLTSTGLKTDGSDIVIAHFADHESHVRIFWACCLGKYLPLGNFFFVTNSIPSSRHPILPDSSASR